MFTLVYGRALYSFCVCSISFYLNATARNELRAVRRRAYVATLTRVSAGQIASGVAAKAALFAENVACESRQYVVGHIHAVSE